jgi:small-conductance mechanosensitive channel
MVDINDIISMEIPLINITVGNVLSAIIIFIIGYIVSVWISKSIYKSMMKKKIQKILAEFISRVLRILLIFLVLIIAVGFLGIDVGAGLISLSVVFGFVIGFAFQDMLGNLAAGFMLALTKPFKAGDFVEISGITGSIANVGVSITTLISLDNKRVIIPNSKVWGEPIINYTALKTRMIDMGVGISYSDDMGKAIQVAMKVLNSHPKVLKQPAPSVAVDNLGDSSVDLIVRPWVKTEDYWPVRWELIQQIKDAFDKEGISIPFPQTDVHLFQSK